MTQYYKEIITSEQLLNYKSNNIEARDNTALHDAILNNDLESLIRLLVLNRQLPLEQSVLNKQSWGNSPLMLALKAGNSKAALVLLKEKNININLNDERGFQAIHWACIFRFDDVIAELLAFNPNVCIAYSKKNKRGKGWFPNYEIIKRITPAMLYQYNWPSKIDELVIPKSGDLNDGDGFRKLTLTTVKYKFF